VLELDDGYVFSDAYELLNLLKEADNVDGYFERLVVYDSKDAKKLEELGVLSGSARGSYSKGKNHKEFWDKAYLEVYGTPRD
jgi:hypothetical protein